MDGPRRHRRVVSESPPVFRFRNGGIPLRRALRGVPKFRGLPIAVEFACGLAVSGGKLVSSGGVAVHAATFLNERRVIVDRELEHNPRELRRILLHEIFHFVWRRLGNGKRAEWNELISQEFQAGARGEMGWSAEWRKDALKACGAATRIRKWREYVCESFCDSAASLFVRTHGEITLKPRFRLRRERWLERLMDQSPLPV